VYSDKRDALTIGQFYDGVSGDSSSQRFRPLNEGVLLAFMYLGILFPREKWSDLIPKSDLSLWSLTPRRLSFPKKPKPSLFDVVRRIRNSLGHASPTIDVPAETTATDMASQVTVTFRDKNTSDPGDTFEVKLCLGQALHLAKMLHKTVLEELKQRESAS
jgi:hypothetical protein